MAPADFTPFERALFDRLLSYVPEGMPIQIPPPVGGVIPVTFERHVEGESLHLRCVAAPAYANPMGVYQGGILMAVMDVGFGTLSMLTAQAPCVSVTMESSFMRPMPADGREFTVDVRLRAQMRSMLFLEAGVTDAAGLAIAAASTAMRIVKGR